MARTAARRDCAIELRAWRHADWHALSTRKCSAGHAKAIIRVLEFGRNARARRAARNFNHVPPGTSARGAAHAVLRPARIALWSLGVILRVIPIGAPFVNVVAHVEQAI